MGLVAYKLPNKSLYLFHRLDFLKHWWAVGSVALQMHIPRGLLSQARNPLAQPSGQTGRNIQRKSVDELAHAAATRHGLHMGPVAANRGRRPGADSHSVGPLACFLHRPDLSICSVC